MRPDRDDNIQVNVENIVPNMMNMFVKRPDDYQDASLHTPYDVLSVNSVRKETVLKFNFHIHAIFNVFGLASDLSISQVPKTESYSIFLLFGSIEV